MQITIFGTGNFGQLIAKLCPATAEVNLLSLRSCSDSDLKKNLSQTDILFLAIPFSAYDLSLRRIKPFLKSEALVVDVCSVKVIPQKKIEQILPKHQNLLITHPLFGPQSSKNGEQTSGLSLVVCRVDGNLAELVISYCKDYLKLKIIKMDSAEHDRQMANAQALTFFTSEALAELKLGDQILKTPSFEELLDVAHLTEKESADLLSLIQNDNPFAEQIRLKFIDSINRINNKYT